MFGGIATVAADLLTAIFWIGLAIAVIKVMAAKGLAKAVGPVVVFIVMGLLIYDHTLVLGLGRRLFTAIIS